MPKLTKSEIDTLIDTLQTELKNYELGLGDVALVTSRLSAKLGEGFVQLIRELRAEVNAQFRTILEEQASRLISIGGCWNARLSASDYDQTLIDTITAFQYNFSAHQAGFQHITLVDPRLTIDFLASQSKMECIAVPSDFHPINGKATDRPRVMQWKMINPLDKHQKRYNFSLEQGMMVLMHDGFTKYLQRSSVMLPGSVDQYGCVPIIIQPDPPLYPRIRLGSDGPVHFAQFPHLYLRPVRAS